MVKSNEMFSKHVMQLVIVAIGRSYLHQTINHFKQVNHRLINKQTNASDLVLPIVAAASAIACVGTSLFALFLGSWFLQRMTSDCRPKCLLILTILFVFFSCMLIG